VKQRYITSVYSHDVDKNVFGITFKWSVETGGLLWAVWKT